MNLLKNPKNSVTIVTLLGINSRYVKAIHYDSMTIVTLIIGSSVDIFVKAIGGMTIVTLLGHRFIVCQSNAF